MVARNYGGWDTRTDGARRAEIEALTGRLRADVAAGGEVALQPAVRACLDWFQDGHLYSVWTEAEGAAVAWPALRRAIDEAGARATLAARGAGAAPVEGLWQIDDTYRLAVLARPSQPDVFDAIVLSSTATGWSPGDVKAVLRARADGGFDVEYGAGDRTLSRFAATLVSRGAVLQTAGFGVWLRVLDDPAEALAARRRFPGFEFSLERVDAATGRLRIASFGLEHAEAIRALVDAHRAELLATPRLIIDVRDNPGGGDQAFMPLLAFTYTRPIHRIGVETRATADNIAQLSALLAQVRPVAPDVAVLIEQEIARMEAATTPYVPGWPHPFETIRLDAVQPGPACVAVLIDGAASAAENFILAARQSSRVTLMGQANSAGVLDFGNVTVRPAPSGRLTLHWPMTRSLRLPLDPVDPDGIAPDVRIPGDAADPVAWSAQWLSRDPACGARE